MLCLLQQSMARLLRSVVRQEPGAVPKASLIQSRTETLTTCNSQAAHVAIVQHGGWRDSVERVLTQQSNTVAEPISVASKTGLAIQNPRKQMSAGTGHIFDGLRSQPRHRAGGSWGQMSEVSTDWGNWLTNTFCRHVSTLLS